MLAVPMLSHLHSVGSVAPALLVARLEASHQRRENEVHAGLWSSRKSHSCNRIEQAPTCSHALRARVADEI